MKNITKALVVLLCLVLVAFSVISCGKDPADTTAPDTTVPDVTTPEETTPEETDPEVTVPEETDPEVTLPEETLPDETLPDETLPDETLPGETEPEETKPADTTKPAETTGPHKHEYQVVEKYPTCDADGTITYICACGDSYEEPGEPAVGHAWIADGEPTKSATPCLTPDSQAYKCVSCGATEVRQSELVPHDFTVSTQLVSAADDPLGKGYEILACSICDLHMKKVTANHVDGHYFVETEDGFVCACGAIAVDSEEILLGTNNFEDKKEVAAPSGFEAVDGKLWISGYNGQKSVQSSAMPVYIDLLSGVYNGKSVPNVLYSFDLIYNAPVPAGYGSEAGDKHFFTWRSGSSGKNYEVSLFLHDDGAGKLIAFGESGKVTLEMGESYTFTVAVVPETRQISLTVKGNFMGEGDALAEAEIVLVEPKKMYGESFVAAFFSRDKFYYANAEEFALYLDNLSVSYKERSLNGENITAAPCEHTFVSERYVDVTHPLDEMWFRDTCTVCERFLERQDCTLLGGHVWSDTPDESLTVGASCLEPGKEFYPCEICDAIDERVIPALGHTWDKGTVIKQNDCTSEGEMLFDCIECDATYTEILPMEHAYVLFHEINNQAMDPYGIGYELWACPGCDVMIRVDGDHESGHFFGETNVCACGAKYVEGGEKGVVSYDFESGTANGWSQNIAADIREGGKWRATGQDSQPNLAPGNAPTLAQILGGALDGNPIDLVKISMDISFTGMTAGPEDNHFIAFRTWADGEKSYKDEITVQLVPDGKKLAIKSNLASVSMNPGEDEIYTLSIYADPATETLSVYIEGNGIEKTKLGEKKTVNSFADFYQLIFRGNKFERDASVFAVYLDNLSVDAVVMKTDETEMADSYCAASAYTIRESTSADYPAADGWMEKICDDCGDKFFYLDCEYVGGHIFGQEPTEVDPVESCKDSGSETYTCRVCGETETKELPAQHVYSVFVSRTEQADDPLGVGYEFWACPGCHMMNKVEANHPFGHFFDEEGLCACGAKLVDETRVLGTHNFTNTDPRKGTDLRIGNILDTDMNIESVGGVNRWLFSKLNRENKQAAIYPSENSKLADALDGELDGVSLTKLSFSFTLSYTGDMVFTSPDANEPFFLDWRSKATGAEKDNNDIRLRLLSVENKLMLGGKNLAADVDYRVQITLDLTAGTYVVTLTGGDYEGSQLSSGALVNKSEEFFSVCFRTNKYEIDPAVGKIYMSDLKLDYDCRVLNATGKTDVCAEHAFTRTPSDNAEYPAEDGYNKLFCENCGCYYYQIDCELAGGHLFGEEPTSVTPGSSCLEDTVVVYTCLVCGETKEEKLPTDHVYSSFEALVSDEDDISGSGYELWACACGEMIKTEANHPSGHKFDAATLTCACGAKAEAKNTLMGSRDFSTTTTDIPSFGAALEKTLDLVKVGDDYKWRTSTSTNQLTIYPSTHPAIPAALGGQYNGNPVSAVTFSFEVSYTGTPSFAAQTFVSWRTKRATDTGNTEEFNFKLSTSNGKIIVDNIKTELQPDTEYTVTLTFVPGTNAYKATLSGGSLGVITMAEGTTKLDLTLFTGMCFRAKNCPIDAADGALYVDDFSISCDLVTPVSGPTKAPACEHTFDEKAVEGETDLYTYTCSKCDKFYTSTKELRRQVIDVVKLDFADKNSVGATELTLTNLIEDDLSDGMWDLAIRGKQTFIRPSNSSVEGVDTTRNQTLAKILSGTDANGDTVNAIELTFKLKYTGSLKALGTGKVLINMLEDTVNGSNMFQLYLDGDATTGKAVMYEYSSKTNTMTLEADTLYTITVRLVLAENRIVITVADPAGNETTLANVVPSKAFAPTRQFGIGRTDYKSTEFSLGFDELALSYEIIK